MIKKTLIAAGLIATQAFAINAFAQGEVGPVKPAKPAMEVSKQDKDAARTERKAEGTEAARKQPQGEVGPVKKAAPAHAGQHSDTTRAEKKAEAKEANQAMNKSPMPQRGELGQTKATN